MSRRLYLRSQSGMAAAFLAMNQVFGNVYSVDSTEAEDQEAAQELHDDTKDQFIFDVQTHHVHDDYSWEGQLWLRDTARGNNQDKTPWNPELVGQELDLKYYKFEYYLKDMFFDSDTTTALLSTSPSVDPYKILLSDEKPVVKVLVTPFINSTNFFVSPSQFIRKLNMIFAKSALLLPIFFISPDKIVFPDLSLFSIMSPTKTKCADCD